MGLDIRHSISNSLFFFPSTDRYVCSFRKRFSAIRPCPFKRQQLVPAHLKCPSVNVTRSGVRFCRSHYFEFSPAVWSSIHRPTLHLRSRLFQRRTRTAMEFDLDISGSRLNIYDTHHTRVIPVPPRTRRSVYSYMKAISTDQRTVQSYNTAGEGRSLCHRTPEWYVRAEHVSIDTL